MAIIGTRIRKGLEKNKIDFLAGKITFNDLVRKTKALRPKKKK